MKNKKIIVFDFDGVLFDSTEVTMDFSRENFPGITDDEIRDLHLGNIYKTTESFNKPKVVETEEEKLKRWDRYTQRKFAVTMYPGIKELVQKLSQDAILTINTSAWNNTTLPLLEKSGIKESFSLVVTSDMSMDKVEKFRIIGNHFNTDPKEFVFITDSLGDVVAAQELGIPTIAVLWGMHTKKYFKEEPHPNIIGFAETVEELEKHLTI